MPYLKVNDQRMFYAHKRGIAGAANVVLVHGAGGSHLGWPAALRQLPDYAVYAVDLPGHGRSAPPGCDNIIAYSDTLAAFVTTLKSDKVILIGHSMGGAIAQMMALRHAEKTAGLILIGTGARLPVSDMILGQATTNFAATVDFVTKYAWARGTPDSLIEIGREQMNESSPQVLRGDYVACNTFDVRERLSQIHVPTLVIAGSVDMMTPYKFGQFLADNIPGAQLVVIEGGGHMMMLEQPGLVTTAVTRFLQENFAFAQQN